MNPRSLIMTAFMLVACDRAKSGYEECEALQAKGDLDKARLACEGAAKQDPTSKYGALARDKAQEIHQREAEQEENALRNKERELLKWEQDLKAGRIPPGTPRPGSPPGSKCNCEPKDPLCACP